MPLGMWLLYKWSFRSHLQTVLGCTKREAKEVTKQAKPKYKAIIARVPEFEKEDRFKMNLVNCALLTAFVCSMETRPTVEALTQFYSEAMMNAPTRWFCRRKRPPRCGQPTATSIRGTWTFCPIPMAAAMRRGLQPAASAR